MGLKDYYQVLGLNRSASAEDVKRAFRQLAMRYHPDHNLENTQQAEVKFKEINEAYTVLGDEYRRWQYDRLADLSRHPRMAAMPDDGSVGRQEWDRLMRTLMTLTGAGVASGRWGRAGSWGCGRRQGGGCRRRWQRE